MKGIFMVNETEIKDDNYINILGWMVTKLNLKNTELMVYACIYGFSQDGYSRYKGGLRYLQEWCGCSKNTVMTALQKLEAKKLIIKYEIEISRNLKLCEYSADLEERFKILDGGSKIEPNNKYNISIYNNSNNDIDNNISNIIKYLNYILGSKFAPTTKNTRQAITARLSEGYTVDDFKMVIDHKFKDWGNNEKMRQYLTPDTLFRPANFEKYYNMALMSVSKVRTETVVDKEIDEEPAIDLWGGDDE